LASLRSPKTRIHLVGFASFSQNEDLRSVASFPQKQDLPSVASFRDLPSGGFVPPKTRREGIWSVVSLTMSNSPIRAAGHLRPDIANFHLDRDIRDLSCGQLKYPFRSRHWMPLALNIVV
jgi:hypothetical protein